MKPYLEERREQERCLRFLSRVMHIRHVTLHYQVESERVGAIMSVRMH